MVGLFFNRFEQRAGFFEVFLTDSFARPASRKKRKIYSPNSSGSPQSCHKGTYPQTHLHALYYSNLVLFRGNSLHMHLDLFHDIGVFEQAQLK